VVLRRRTLLTTAATVPLAATAGCTDGFGFGTAVRDPPAYARWVPATGPENDGTYYTYVDWAGIDDVESLAADLPTDDTPFERAPGDVIEEGVDALIAVPALGVLLTAFGFGVGVSVYAIEPLWEFLDEYAGSVGAGPDRVPTETPEDGKPDVGSLEATLLTGHAIVLEGSFDVEAVEAAAIDAEFERAGTHRDARMYEGEGRMLLPQRLSFAAREEALVFGFTPGGDSSSEGTPSDGTAPDDDSVRSRVEHILDVEAGERERLADRNGDAGWALGRAGHGHVVFGAWGDFDPDEVYDGPLGGRDVEGATPEPLPDSDGEVYSLTLGESELSGDMAAAYPADETPDRETVESGVGNTADEQSVDVDDRRVAVTGTWELGTDQQG
jgi:hypothetical protein